MSNLIDKHYKSCDLYLETHFRLLREELVRPLRENIQFIRQLRAKNANYDVKKITEFKVYTDISMIGFDVDIRIGPVLVTKFNIKQIKSLDWSVSDTILI